uniref:Tubulin-specific chaperone cofactor E-like protein n=2 Tax=Hirondellea gigas TaxID=1518452 RepID=A0A6A7FXX5_9CRUS
MPSLPEAVDKKYGDPENPVTEVACIALQLKRSKPGRQRLPSVLILADCDIEEAGDDAELQKRCDGVRELDIANNKLKHWHEVVKILRHLPALSFLNLSFNRFETPLILPDDFQLGTLTRLVLNGTSIPWHELIQLLQRTPRLEELHVSMNGYEQLKRSEHKYPTVNRIHFNNNPAKDWQQIEVLGEMFPRLEALVLAECPIAELPDDGHYSEYFPQLRYLSLNACKITEWGSVYNINNFPLLSELRLHNCPLYENYNDSDRRSLTIAAVWRVKRLNGGALISPKEREDSERRFIRYYMQHEHKPVRYYELIALHGELYPLVDISLKPTKEVEVKIVYGDIVLTHRFNVYLKVLDVKKQLEPVVSVVLKSLELSLKIMALIKAN